MNKTIVATFIITIALGNWTTEAYSAQETVADSSIVIYDKAYFEMFYFHSPLDIVR